VALGDVWASFEYGFSPTDANIRGTIDETRPTVWHVFGRPGQRHFAVYLLKEPLRLPEGRKLTVVLQHRDKHDGINLGRFRLSVTGSAAVPANNATWTRRENIRTKQLDGFAALGAAHASEGKSQLARTQLEQVVSRDPANSAAVTELASLMLDKHQTDWQVLKPVEMNGKAGETLTLEKDGGIFVSGPIANRPVYTLKLRTDLPTVTAIRLETLPDDRLPKGGAGRYPDNGNFHLSEITAAIESKGTTARNAGTPQPIPIVAAIADPRRHPSVGILKTFDGNPETRWDIAPDYTLPHWAIFRFKMPVKTNGRFLIVTLDSGISPWGKHGLGRFRLSAAAHPLPIWLKTGGQVNSPWAKLGAAYALDGATEKAVAAFATAFDRDKDQSGRAQVLQLATRFDAVVTGLLTRRPKDPAVLTTAARIALKDNRPADARKHLELALSNDPTHADAAGELATLVLDRHKLKWQVLKPVEMKSTGGATLALEKDGSIFISGRNPDHDTYRIIAPPQKSKIIAVRLETIPDPRLPGGGAGRGRDGNFVVSNFSLAPRTGAGTAAGALPFSEAVSTFDEAPNWAIAKAIDGVPDTAWATHPRTNRRQSAVFVLAKEAVLGQGFQIELEFRHPRANSGARQFNLGRFRLSVSDDRAAFQREQRAIAARKLTNPWVKLGAALTLEAGPSPGDSAPAVRLLARVIEHAADVRTKIAIAEQAAGDERVLAALIKLRPEVDPLVRFSRRERLAAAGKWKDVHAGYASVVRRLPAGAPWYQYAALCLIIGDGKGYHDHIAWMVKQPGQPVNAGIAHAYARAVILSADSRVPKSKCIEWAERAASQKKTLGPRTLHTAAMAHFRAGNLNKARQAVQQSKRRGWKAHALNWIALGLVEHKAGNLEAAKAQLQKVRDWIKQTEKTRGKRDSPPLLLADWLELNVLLPELERALSAPTAGSNGKAPDSTKRGER
jgi:tetratricopeptide (TPR) repeat protein